MVAEREEAEERQRMKRLAAKHYNMLGYYVRMIDYITIETLVYLVKSNVTKFYNEMVNRAANTRLFNTVVKYGKDCMVFHPDCEEFKDIIKSIIDGMVSDIG
eukprot:CAMPEP_0168313684 /NCGR_PEP_ID=MMETSP0210-20121227/3665_1 /TAXON_ID=40633 /ORGANISM="Condylostoma magnum, Strain COL2" /LENGTH=101 /DNA_ID=CAMNT_0008273443 /DNA_START=988 /DNA_END=1293 /DNA_ORIENTATION=+